MNIQNESERARDLQARCNSSHIDRIKEKIRSSHAAQEERNLTDALTNSLSREKMLRKLNWIEVKTQLDLYYLETKNEETRIILEHFDKYYKNL
jgi:hypothetical protein